MADWFFENQFRHSCERHDGPFPVPLFPIKRRIPTSLLDRIPTSRKPKLRTFVASVLNKCQELPTCDHSGGQAKGRGINSVPRPLIVVTKPRALMSHPVKTLIELQPLNGRYR